MSTSYQIIPTLSETTAIRLFNSVLIADEPSDRLRLPRRQQSQAMQQNSIESIRSLNEFNYSCRICRWNRNDLELTKCPCLCKGSVGFIHLLCLKKWIMHRRDNHCEICNASFNIPDEKFSIRRMIKTFFYNCACPIMKHLLFSISLMPLTHIILQQVVLYIENINLRPNEDLSIKEVIMAGGALMTSSALFFNFFEFITTRIILVRNILRHWWLYGSSSDFALVHTESELLDFFS